MSARLPRLARWLHALTVLSMVAVPLFLFFMAYQIAIWPEMIHDLDLSVPVAGTGVTVWLGLSLGLLPVVALLWSLNELRKLLRLYMQQEVLTERAAGHIRRMGAALLVVALLRILVQPIQTVLLTWAAPPGERVVAIALSDSELGFFLAAGLLTLIGWAMSDAARIAEENRGFV